MRAHLALKLSQGSLDEPKVNLSISFRELNMYFEVKLRMNNSLVQLG